MHREAESITAPHSMSEKTIHSVGIIMNGVTGRMGLNQHLRRSIYAIMQQGGVKLSAERSHHAQADSGRPQLRQARGHQRRVRRPPLDHQSRQRPRQPRRTPSTSIRRPPTAAPPTSSKAIAAGKHIYCEKPVSDSLDVALELLALAEKAGVKHGVVQDKLWLPGMLKLQDPDGPRLLRPDLQRARRVRLLGLRRRHRPHPAPLLELPQGGRRRHHHRHALPLALRARQSLRPREGRLLPRRHPHPHPLGRSRQALRVHRRRFRLRHLRIAGRTASSWRTSIPPGPSACAATTC